MTYVKATLSAAAAAFVALLVPAMYFLFWTMRSHEVVGLALVPAGVAECLRSPLFWIAVILLFGMFLAASRLKSKVLRALFFWTPVVGASALGALVAGGYAWLSRRPPPF